MEDKKYMIGNWVRCTGVDMRNGNSLEMDCKIHSLPNTIEAEYSIGTEFPSEEGYEVSPIELNEEWFTKLGFERRMVKLNGQNRQRWIKFSFILSDHPFETYFFYDWIGGNKNIKYVHQLQNLYFALTGKELEINTTT